MFKIDNRLLCLWGIHKNISILSLLIDLNPEVDIKYRQLFFDKIIILIKVLNWIYNVGYF